MLPHGIFARTVRQHRETIAAIDAMTDPGFEQRVTRTLACVLAGDELEREDADVQAEANRRLEAYREACASKWTSDELEDFARGQRAFTPEFQAWLDDSLAIAQSPSAGGRGK
jgi:hypothetical protein